MDTISSIPTEQTNAAAACYVPRLPAELWLLIFHFATSTSAPHYHYEPFQPCPDTIAALSDAALRDKCALMLVCKHWRALTLALDTLYEDIRIGPGLSTLHAALCQTPVDGDDSDHAAARSTSRLYRVRRAVLPYLYTATPTRDVQPALTLLVLLPHLEVLVRPPLSHFHPLPRFGFGSSMTPALHALRRLEWAFDGTGAAARAGGINDLDDVLRAAPDLCELVLVGPMPLAALRQHYNPRLCLRAIRTLRLHAGAAACPFVARQTTYWALPALENVVVTGTVRGGGVHAEALEPLLEAFGGLVRVLEVQLGGVGARGNGSIGDALLSMTDVVGRIVGACPKLEELNVRLGVVEGFENPVWDSSQVEESLGAAPVPRTTWACTHSTLQRLGIYVDAEEWTAEMWTAVVEYVAQFEKGCPALRCVALYVPDAGVAAQKSQFRALRETTTSNGRQLLLRSVHAYTNFY